ncbi:MAG: DNA adenine methylase [Candidatus Heimdallarchaeota archaeon]
MKSLEEYLFNKKEKKSENKNSTALNSNNIYSHDFEKIPIHHWYTLVAGFSGNFIRENLRKYNITKNKILLDPFMGTGTTALIGMLNYIKVIGNDANPFTHFVAKVKTNFSIDIKELIELYNTIKNNLESNLENDAKFKWEYIPTTDLKDHLKTIKNSSSNQIDDVRFEDKVPKMPHLYRWLSPNILKKVIDLKDILKENKIKNNAINDFIFLAFASILLPISNLQLSGPKIAYRRKGNKRVLCKNAPIFSLFLEKTKMMINDFNIYSKFNNLIKPDLNFGDSRELDKIIKQPIDLILTSPPYLNEVDYLDNTRLELYFLDFVKDDSDLKDLKRMQIRANSKYLFNDNRDYPKNIPNINSFDKIIEKCEIIREEWVKKKWGWDHPRLVCEYFIDMTKHLESVTRILKPNGHYVFIVGDSAIINTLIPTDQFLADIAIDLGYSEAKVEPFRKRGSSRHKINLRESVVSLTL